MHGDVLGEQLDLESLHDFGSGASHVESVLQVSESHFNRVPVWKGVQRCFGVHDIVDQQDEPATVDGGAWCVFLGHGQDDTLEPRG